MKKFSWFMSSLLPFVASVAFAEMDPAAMEAMKKAGTPGEAHSYLKPMVGKWKATVKHIPAPGAAVEETSGTAENTMVLGDRFLKQDFTGTMMNMPFNGMGMTGYDNMKKKFVSTWTDSMSTTVMVMEGSADKNGKVITTTGECKNPVTKKPMKMRMVTKIEGNDRHVFENWMRDEMGKEFKALEIVYTRM